MSDERLSADSVRRPSPREQRIILAMADYICARTGDLIPERRPCRKCVGIARGLLLDVLDPADDGLCAGGSMEA